MGGPDEGAGGPATAPVPRRVVLGAAVSDRAAVRSDGPVPSVVALPGADIARLLWLGGPARDVEDGEPAVGEGRVPAPPGGMSASVVRIQPPRADRWPSQGGWRTSTTLDLTVVLDGQLVIGVEHDGDHAEAGAGADVVLAPGEALVTRGSCHRLRAGGGRPVDLLVVHLEPDPAAAAGSGTRPVAPPAPGAGAPGMRRVVTGPGPDGRSTFTVDGLPPLAGAPDGVVVGDVWRTGGPLAAVDQGGDLVAPPLTSASPAGAVVLSLVELGTPPAGPWAGPAGPTLAVAVVVAGRAEVTLGDGDPVAVGRGDVVVARGVPHRWVATAGAPARLAVLAVAT